VSTLAIAIPTFDRPNELKSCIAALAPQLTPDVPLLIVDNASQIPAEAVLKEILDPYPKLNVRIVRNAFNIGGNANILRCVELTDSDWIWLLGDDDVPHPGAVDLAKAEIAKNDQAICINFNSAFGPDHQELRTKGRLDFLSRCPGVGNVIFISTNLYHASALRPNLYLGHRYAYAMAPHFAMLLSSMSDGDEVVFLNSELVSAAVCDGANHWSSISQALSWPTLLELKLTPAERRMLAHKLQGPSLASIIVQLLGTGIKTNDFETPRFFYRQVTSRGSYNSTLIRRLTVVAGRCMLACPKVSALAVDFVLNRTKASSIAQRLRRDLDDPHG
jgi:glycosyltransferase involved in cell wall biosynthesis